MSFLQLAKERFSLRKFIDKKVEKEKIEQILESARIAPTAHNNQPQRIIVITEPDTLEKVSQCTPYGFHAPLNFLICYDKTKSWVRQADKEEMGYIDAAIVATHMMLTIQDLGLGSTWVGFLDPQKTKEVFELPENFVPIAFMPTGYPTDPPQIAQLHEKRIDVESFVFYNKIK